MFSLTHVSNKFISLQSYCLIADLIPFRYRNTYIMLRVIILLCRQNSNETHFVTLLKVGSLFCLDIFIVFFFFYLIAFLKSTSWFFFWGGEFKLITYFFVSFFNFQNMITLLVYPLPLLNEWAESLARLANWSLGQFSSKIFPDLLWTSHEESNRLNYIWFRCISFGHIYKMSVKRNIGE